MRTIKLVCYGSGYVTILKEGNHVYSLENDETWLKDDILYPSLTHRGGLTKVPNNMQPVVTVLFAHATNGQLYCRSK